MTDNDLNEQVEVTVDDATVITVPIDATLSNSNEAADAKAVGDALALKADKSELQAAVKVNNQPADAQGLILIDGSDIPVSDEDTDTLAEAVTNLKGKTAEDIPMSSDAGAKMIAEVVNANSEAIENMEEMTGATMPMEPGSQTMVKAAIEARAKTVNRQAPDIDGNIDLSVVPLAENLQSDKMQSVDGSFIIRTTGGSSSVSDGKAYPQHILGTVEHDGYVAEVLNMTVIPVTRTEPDEPITATIDRDTFVEAVTESGTTNLYYTTEWSEDPEDYGVTVSGTPVAGDHIKIEYTKEARGTIKVADPDRLIGTGWNLFNYNQGYARVVKYSTEYGYKIGGTYTSLAFSATLTGERSSITPGADGIFNVASDGYVFVTGGNNTDTYILATWSDWMDGPASGYWEPYKENGVDLSYIMSTYFPYGLLAVGTTRDEIDLAAKRAISRIERKEYSEENRAAAAATGRGYSFDENNVYIVRESPVLNAITIEGEYTVSEHGLEWFTETVMPLITEILYGKNLRDKLERDVLTISPQNLAAEEQAQVRRNIGVMDPPLNGNGTAAQLLKTNGDGTTEWTTQGTPTDAQVGTAVSAWLTDHPEATTTVQDGAISRAKLNDDLKAKTDAVPDLKSAFIYPTSKKIAVSQGYYAFSNGGTVDSSKYCKSDFLEVDCILETSTYTMFILAYTVDETYVGGWNGTEFTTSFNASSGVKRINVKKWLDNYPNYRFRVDYYNNNNDLTPANVLSDLVVKRNITEVVSDIEKQFVDSVDGKKLTGSKDSSGYYNASYHIMAGHSYLIKNTSASASISVKIKDNDGDDIYTITGGLTKGNEIVYPSEYSGPVISVYGNGAFSFEIADISSVGYNLKDITAQVQELGQINYRVLATEKDQKYPFYAKGGDSVSVETVSGSDITSSRIFFYRRNGETTYYNIIGTAYGNKRTFTIGTGEEFVYCLIQSNTTAEALYITNNTSWFNTNMKDEIIDHRIKDSVEGVSLTGSKDSSGGLTLEYRFIRGHKYWLKNNSVSASISAKIQNDAGGDVESITGGLAYSRQMIYTALHDGTYLYVYGNGAFSFEIVDVSSVGFGLKKCADISKTKTELDNARHVQHAYSATVKPTLSILHFSDLHGDRSALDRIVNEASEYTGIDEMICTGDIVGNAAEQISSWWKNKILTCIGNHDSASYSAGTGYNWTALSMADRDAYYIAPFESEWNLTGHTEGTSYYYKDYDDQKIRLIVMDGMLYTNPGDEATAQTSWLEGLLTDAITNSLHVLIAIHAPHGGATAESCSFSKYGGGTMPVWTDCNTPQSVIDAVAAKITAGLKFIGYICGHTHQDNIWDAENDGKQLMYCVTCANVSASAQWINSDQGRNDFEDAFNIVVIDTEHTLVKIIRGGGANMDDHMRTRKAICFNYSTGEKVGEIL